MTPVEDFAVLWVIKADNDLTVARDERSIKRESIITDAICFHCQQAAEKMLKAYLSRNKIEFKKVHNLEYLAQLCSSIDPEFLKLDFGNLSGYGVAIRYPDDFYMPTLQEADECIGLAQKIRDFVAARLKV